DANHPVGHAQSPIRSLRVLGAPVPGTPAPSSTPVTSAATQCDRTCSETYWQAIGQRDDPLGDLVATAQRGARGETGPLPEGNQSCLFATSPLMPNAALSWSTGARARGSASSS